jgi:hypothetical protein
LDAAYVELSEGLYRASPLTVGPWNPEHQHAGPPSALICRAIERAAAPHGLTHLGRLTVNLLRPAPVGECRIEIGADYIGRNAGHFSGRLTAGGKEIARFTALMQREEVRPAPAVLMRNLSKAFNVSMRPARPQSRTWLLAKTQQSKPAALKQGPFSGLIR